MSADAPVTRIRGRHVVAYDADLGGHTLLEGGEVVYRGERILHVGGRYPGPVDREIDARDKLVMPGLIDVHALMDVGIHLLLTDRERDRGYRSREFLESDTDAFDETTARRGAEATMYLLLRSGVTTFCGITAMVFKRWHDPAWEPAMYAEVAASYGLRAYLSHHFRAMVPYLDAAGETQEVWDEAKGFEGLERNIAFVRRAERGDFGPRVRGLLFPYTADTLTPDLWRAIREAADELGVGYRCHTAQRRSEVDATLERYGRSPVEQLDHLGVLGPDVLLTHTLFGRGHRGGPGLSDDEVALLANSGTNVGHTPWIYTFRGGYLDAFGRYRRAGINLGIGTDTYPNDMIRELEYAAVMGTVAEASPTAATAADVFHAATLGGARFLGRDDLGRLAPGAAADIVLVDQASSSFAPTLDPIRSLVYYANLRDVDTVIVGGDTLMEGGEVPGVDEARLAAQADAVLREMGRVFEGWDARGRTTAERFPPSFPPRSAGDAS